MSDLARWFDRVGEEGISLDLSFGPMPLCIGDVVRVLDPDGEVMATGVIESMTYEDDHAELVDEMEATIHLSVSGDPKP